MKVLIGVDGSSNSFAAVEFVARLLSAEHDEIVLLFATPEMSFDDDRLDPSIEDRARFALSRTVLEAALERLPPEWRTKAEQKQATGAASAALLDAIESEKADLVSVGFRGTSGILAEFVLGSVSRAIVHSAKVPALVVKSEGTTEAPANRSPGPLTRHMHVLAAYDAPQFEQPAVELLQKFSWPPETVGTVMTVVQPMFIAQLPDWVKRQRDPDVAAMASAWEEEHQEHLQATRAELENFRAGLPSCFLAHDTVVAEGRPAEQIIAQILERAIDLVVLGSRSRGAVKRLLLGSTTEQVLREAPCSVLIVR
jgi:nucleotide-binding universal stress UspA family protein